MYRTLSVINLWIISQSINRTVSIINPWHVNPLTSQLIHCTLSVINPCVSNHCTLCHQSMCHQSVNPCILSIINPCIASQSIHQSFLINQSVYHSISHTQCMLPHTFLLYTLQTHTHMHTHTHAHIHTHAHSYTQICITSYMSWTDSQLDGHPRSSHL